jgi:hypothetical protein
MSAEAFDGKLLMPLLVILLVPVCIIGYKLSRISREWDIGAQLMPGYTI